LCVGVEENDVPHRRRLQASSRCEDGNARCSGSFRTNSSKVAGTSCPCRRQAAGIMMLVQVRPQATPPAIRASPVRRSNHPMPLLVVKLSPGPRGVKAREAHACAPSSHGGASERSASRRFALSTALAWKWLLKNTNVFSATEASARILGAHASSSSSA